MMPQCSMPHIHMHKQYERLINKENEKKFVHKGEQTPSQKYSFYNGSTCELGDRFRFLTPMNFPCPSTRFTLHIREHFLCNIVRDDRTQSFVFVFLMLLAFNLFLCFYLSAFLIWSSMNVVCMQQHVQQIMSQCVQEIYLQDIDCTIVLRIIFCTLWRKT